MRIFCFAWMLLLAGCAMHESGWLTYHAGPFTVTMPPDLKKTAATGTDSYMAEFASPRMTVSFDYGMAANNFEDWPPATEFELVKIDQKEARIGTVRQGFKPGFGFSTQVSFRDTGGKNLTITAACKTLADCDDAKRIFRSIRFVPSERP